MSLTSNFQKTRPVTGPLWFLLYINDLLEKLSATCHLFADDCLLYVPISEENDMQILQEDLNTLEKWQEDWRMKFNPSKSATMSIASSRNSTKHIYSFCNQQLESVTSHPYLGVELTDNFTWGTHIGQSIKKAQRAMGLIKRNLCDYNEEVKITAFKAIV